MATKFDKTDLFIIALAFVPIIIAGGMAYVAIHFVIKFW